MKFVLYAAVASALSQQAACVAKITTSPAAPMGKVVVYRNGVAYFERTATVLNNELKLSVPRTKVDDFLKSLMVRDLATGKPLPISFPSQGNRNGSGGMVEMVVKIPGDGARKVSLTYITEAPAWKPSYRVSVDKSGSVKLQGWAVVDNTSGEDWKNVVVGVGASSAMSFRYDLWSIRQVHRQTLSSHEKFAIAPPRGTSSNSDRSSPKSNRLVAALDESIIGDLAPAPQDDDGEFAVDAVVADRATTKSGRGMHPKPGLVNKDYARRRMAKKRARQTQDRRRASMLAAAKAQIAKSRGTYVIVGNSRSGRDLNDGLAMANKVRNELIAAGVAPGRVVARGEAGTEGRPAGVRVVENTQPSKNPQKTDPVGESHFQSKVPMSVDHGASVMVSILDQGTKGRLVYLYDAESDRGNQKFAFNAVRLVNPTDNALESGPITVYGETRFIGEGLADPIPPKSSAIVPFALDRQVEVQRKRNRKEHVAGITRIGGGVATCEISHARHTELTLTSRAHKPSTVYVRHTLGDGWDLEASPKKYERQGNTYFFRVELQPNTPKTVRIVEQTPLTKSLSLRSYDDLGMMQAFLSDASAHPELAKQIEEAIALHTDMNKQRERIRVVQAQLQDYRSRLDELHIQIVTLKAVKSSGPLLRDLKNKMRDISRRVQKATIAIVDAREQLMILKIKFREHTTEMRLAAAPVRKPSV